MQSRVSARLCDWTDTVKVRRRGAYGYICQEMGGKKLTVMFLTQIICAYFATGNTFACVIAGFEFFLQRVQS